MASKPEPVKSGINPDNCDLTGAVEIDRRWMTWLWGGLTFFQQAVCYSVLMAILVSSSLLAWMLQPGPLVGVAMVLLMLFLGLILVLTWSKNIDRLNEDMKKKQHHVVIDTWHAKHDPVHEVNGRGMSDEPRILRVVATATARYKYDPLSAFAPENDMESEVAA